MRDETVQMEWARAKDWLIGAAGMLLVLAAGMAILWWSVTEPGGGAGDGSGSLPEAPAERRAGTVPPADLGEDQVWLADLALSAGTVVTADAMLRDVRAVGEDVATRPDGLVAGHVTVHATLPFHVVAEELGEATTVRAAPDGQAMVVRTVDVFGRELRVTASGTVEVEDGRIVVEPRSIDIGGPKLLSEALATAARELVTIEHDIDGLPEGLALQDVVVRADGFRARLRGEDVELVP